MSKLTRLHVIVIGVVLNLVALAGAYFFLVKPRMEKFAAADAKLKERTAVADRLPVAEADRQKAELENLQARQDYRRYEDAKMPVISVADRTQAMIALWREQAEVLGPMIENWPRRYGEELLNNVSIPPATTNPNTPIPSPYVIDVGAMSVRGDFYSILRSIEGWNQFNRLVQISPMTIQGVSPSLTANYGLRVIIFPRGKMGPEVAMAKGSTDAAGAGGAGGGMAPPPMPMGAPDMGAGPPVGGPPGEVPGGGMPAP